MSRSSLGRLSKSVWRAGNAAKYISHWILKGLRNSCHWLAWSFKVMPLRMAQLAQILLAKLPTFHKYLGSERAQPDTYTLGLPHCDFWFDYGAAQGKGAIKPHVLLENFHGTLCTISITFDGLSNLTSQPRRQQPPETTTSLSALPWSRW